MSSRYSRPSPVAWDTALRRTMTWMTENPHQRKEQTHVLQCTDKKAKHWQADGESYVIAVCSHTVVQLEHRLTRQADCTQQYQWCAFKCWMQNLNINIMNFALDLWTISEPCLCTCMSTAFTRCAVLSDYTGFKYWHNLYSLWHRVFTSHTLMIQVAIQHNLGITVLEMHCAAV